MEPATLPASDLDFSKSVQASRDAFLTAWTPKPRLSITEIADTYRVLPGDSTSVPGRYSHLLTPYVKEPMDRLHPDDPTQILALEWAAQVGKSTIADNWALAVMGFYPSKMLYALDTDLNAKDWAKDTLDTMIEHSPLLRGLVRDPVSRAKGETIQAKWFPGGRLRIVGAHSASALCRMAAKFVVMDECDRWKENPGYEGNAVSLVLARQSTFGSSRKALIVSTPTVEGDSEIDEWFRRGDQRYFYVPCTRCGEFQVLEFADEVTKEFRLVWTPGHPDEAHYVCRFCGHAMEDRDKNVILAPGVWKPTRPDLGEHGKIGSYNLSVLYAPHGGFSWSDFAAEFEAAHVLAKTGNFEKLKSHINIRHAKTFGIAGDTIDAHVLQDRVEPDWGEFLPAGIKVIVTGTDIHPERRETMVLGIGVGWEMWVLDYVVNLSSPIDGIGWTELDQLIAKEYPFEDGRRQKAAASCVDGRFSEQQVLEYCHRRNRRRIYAIMGLPGKGAIWPRELSKGGKNKDKGIYYQVRVDTAKNDLYAHLRIETPGAKYVHIPDRLVALFPDFLDQLTAERRVKSKHGRWTWEKITKNRRNEVWDTFVYCLAAAHSLVMGGLRLNVPATPAPASAPPPRPQLPPQSPSRTTVELHAPTADDEGDESPDDGDDFLSRLR
jgi:phage terminase large subunit GpA-like protein